jgi:hypothetical protein
MLIHEEEKPTHAITKKKRNNSTDEALNAIKVYVYCPIFHILAAFLYVFCLSCLDTIQHEMQTWIKLSFAQSLAQQEKIKSAIEKHHVALNDCFAKFHVNFKSSIFVYVLTCLSSLHNWRCMNGANPLKSSLEKTTRS